MSCSDQFNEQNHAVKPSDERIMRQQGSAFPPRTISPNGDGYPPTKEEEMNLIISYKADMLPLLVNP